MYHQISSLVSYLSFFSFIFCFYPGRWWGVFWVLKWRQSHYSIDIDNKLIYKQLDDYKDVNIQVWNWEKQKHWKALQIFRRCIISHLLHVPHNVFSSKNLNLNKILAITQVSKPNAQYVARLLYFYKQHFKMFWTSLLRKTFTIPPPIYWPCQWALLFNIVCIFHLFLTA